MGPNQTGLENIIRFRFPLIQTWKNIARLLTESESIFVTQETTYICKHPWAISFFRLDTILGFFSRYDTILGPQIRPSFQGLFGEFFGIFGVVVVVVIVEDFGSWVFGIFGEFSEFSENFRRIFGEKRQKNHWF